MNDQLLADISQILAGLALSVKQIKRIYYENLPMILVLEISIHIFLYLLIIKQYEM